jgi:hypothetical protein
VCRSPFSLVTCAQMVPDFGKFSLNEFVWARFAVITRIFGLNVDGNKTDGE